MQPAATHPKRRILNTTLCKARWILLKQEGSTASSKTEKEKKAKLLA
jgi:hypothetical protein